VLRCIVLVVAVVLASTASAQCLGSSQLTPQQLQMRSFAKTVVTAEARYKIRAGVWATLSELIRSPEWLEAVTLVPPGQAASLVTATSGDSDGFVMPQIRGTFVANGVSYLLLLENRTDECRALVLASDDGGVVEATMRRR
jgi:hypothetical protein